MPSKWEYYTIGQDVERAGVKILKQRVMGDTQDETTYLVERTCPCAEILVLTHRAIRRRETHGYIRCGPCGRAHRATKLEPGNSKEKRKRGGRDRRHRDYPPLKIGLPVWPVPDLD